MDPTKKLHTSDEPEWRPIVDASRDRLEGRTVVVVLLDYSMPGGRSDDVFLELQRIRPNVPVIMMSGYMEEKVTGRFKGLGIVGFLQKPFNRAELPERVGEAIDPTAA
ncbi:response regulator [Gemmatimonadota bacterium]